MDNDFFKRGIELCLAVYRITDKFPEDEVLRRKFREISIDINEFLMYNEANSARSGRVFNCQELENKLKLFNAYCAVAEEQRWVRGINFKIVRDEYGKLCEEWLGYLDKLVQMASGPTAKTSDGQARKRGSATGREKRHLSERQEQVIKFLGVNAEGSTMEDLAGKFKVSKKTIERGLRPLIKEGLVRKGGRTKGARFFAKN